MQQVVMGLDGEMSGTRPEAGHRLVQIGLACAVDASGRPLDALDVTAGPSTLLAVYEKVVGWRPEQSPVCDPGSMQVHGIPLERIHRAAPHDRVDQQVANWLTSHGGTRKARAVVPVGFNVGSFDLPFVRQALPEVAAMLTHRSVDLNAIVTAAAGMQLGGSPVSYAGLKRMAKRWAADELERQGTAPAWHQAGYDAAVSLLALRWLRWVIHERRLPD